MVQPAEGPEAGPESQSPGENFPRRLGVGQRLASLIRIMTDDGSLAEDVFAVQLSLALARREIAVSLRNAGLSVDELATEASAQQSTIEQAVVSESLVVATAENAAKRARLLARVQVGQFGTGGVAAGVAFTSSALSTLELAGAAVGYLVAGLALGVLTTGTTTRVRNLTVVDELASARNVYRAALLEKGILPFLREQINRALVPDYSLGLHFESARGLSELADETFEVATEATEHLRDLLDDMPGGSVGVSGPRGVGKSTLIRAFCRGRFHREGAVGVSVSAPVNYIPREFILHLYGALCRAIAGEERSEVRRTDLMKQVAVSYAFAGLVAGGVILIVLDNRLPSLSSGQVLGVGLLAAAAVVFVFVLMPSLTRGLFGAQPMPSSALLSYGLVRDARTRLERIRYLQSVSTGWSGELKLPIGQAARTGGRTLAEQPLALPDLIGEFRSFATTVAQQAEGGLVIGIDELDKISGADDAQQFLNDIKGVFGIPNSFFLISISEDALANFDRRGVPVRDAFDSSLDDVVRVTYLPLNGTRRLLQRRVVGLGQGFICLSHTIAAGLPRDVIRVCRAIVQCRPDVGPPPSLAQVAERVLRADFNAKRHATIFAVTAFTPLPQVEPVVAWLHDLEMPKRLVAAHAITPPTLASINAPPASDLQPARLVGLLAEEFAAFSYVTLTALELFSALDSTHLEESASMPFTVFDALAAARQSLAVHPRLAWEKTSALRMKHDLEVPTRPFNLSSSQPTAD